MQRFYHQNLFVCPQVEIWNEYRWQDICKILQRCWVSGRKIQWSTEIVWRKANHPLPHGPSAGRGTVPWFPMSILSFVILQKWNVNVTHGFCNKWQRSNKSGDKFRGSGAMPVKNTGQANALSIRLHSILCKFIVMLIHMRSWQSDSPTCVELVVTSQLFFPLYIFCFLITVWCPEKGANMILLLSHTHSLTCHSASSFKAIWHIAIHFSISVIKAWRHIHPGIIKGKKTTLSCPFITAFDVGNLNADELFLLTTMNAQ